MSETSVFFHEGRDYAESSMSFGEVEPLDAPLSGEYADSPTVQTLARRYGVNLDDPAEWDSIADEFEAGYFSAPWPYLDEDL